ncbi:UDP-N-acetylmuramate dehydrogenase [uncultured Sunxiuqinia sp.]|uniref:UDP-N-acetylmuramate dehydrogenase n=1 Tax=uncultured Sunxiuqinia sp. TaxID=1573825 RepID=UPI0030D85E93|tara:strand:+ start:13910 stop:14926 length:1017 start_codon:yes stop_codon:yes gene_type:complete
MIRFFEDYSLKNYNTFGVEAKSRYFFEFTELEDLTEFLQANTSWKDESFFLLGGGSNLLFVNNFDGLIIHPNVPGVQVVHETRNQVWLEVGAGEDWDRFVDYCVKSEYYGLENLSLIPGTVGAAPVQNIGAYGVEVKDFVDTVNGFDLESMSTYSIPAEQCRFAYRNSIFKQELKNRFVVTSVVFRLEKFPEFKLDYGTLKAEVEARGELHPIHVREAVMAIRQSKLPDPAELGNAGSFFKNPVVDHELAGQLKAEFPEMPSYPAEDGKTKLVAAWLIEQCGWKGFREGDAGVHKLQALVLVNYGQATGQELFLLSQKIKASVVEKFGVELEPEANIL